MMTAGLGSGVSGLLGKESPFGWKSLRVTLFFTTHTGANQQNGSANKRDELRLSNDALSGLNPPEVRSLTAPQPSGDHVLCSRSFLGNKKQLKVEEIGRVLLLV